MEKRLISAALLIMICGSIAAENRTYTYSYYDEALESDLPYVGMLRRVSANGLWAVGGDEYDKSGGFIINTQNPEEIIYTEDGCFFDVSDDGLGVGIKFLRTAGGATYSNAGIYVEGEWQDLPLPDETLGSSMAIAISSDMTRIAGHVLCASEMEGEPGHYYPITWKLTPSGNYEIERLYNNIYVPGTYGFIVHTMTPDGKYIGGEQCLDFGDTIAVMLDVETGELIKWHTVEYRDWFFESVGLYFQQMFVDNVMDGWDEYEYFSGRILFSNNRYMFGSHAVVTDVDVATGEGHIENYPAVYDLQEKCWCDSNPQYGAFLSGVSPTETFTTTGMLVQNGVATDINKIIKGDDQVDGIYDFDDNYKIWVGSQVVVNTLGELVESPALVILDEPGLLGAVEKVADNFRPSVSIENRVITVEGGSNADIYTIEGTHVASGSKAEVAPGAYIIVVDGRSFKALVK